MHRCLNIPELVVQIARYLKMPSSRTSIACQDLLAFVLACQFFCEIGLDILWEVLYSPSPLAYVLPSATLAIIPYGSIPTYTHKSSSAPPSPHDSESDIEIYSDPDPDTDSNPNLDNDSIASGYVASRLSTPSSMTIGPDSPWYAPARRKSVSTLMCVY